MSNPRKTLKQDEIKVGEPTITPEVTLEALLEQFKSNPEVGAHVAYLNAQINLLNSGDITETKLNNFRTKLEQLSIDESLVAIKAGNVLFSTVLNRIASTLPKNIEDFATFENIEDGNKIRLSDGYQFDINSLVHWINEKGKFHHVYTGKEFTPEDQLAIIKFAKIKNKPLSVSTKYKSVDDLTQSVLESFAEEDRAARFAMTQISASSDSAAPLSSGAQIQSSSLTEIKYIPGVGAHPATLFNSQGQLSTIAALQAEIETKLVGNEARNRDILLNIAKSSDNKAKVILTTSLCARFLSGSALTNRLNLIDLVTHNSFMGKFILGNPSLCEHLFTATIQDNRRNLMYIMNKNIELAKLAFVTPSLIQHFLTNTPEQNHGNIFTYAYQNNQLANLILTNPILKASLLFCSEVNNRANLLHIAEVDATNAQIILTDDTLREHLLTGGNDIAEKTLSYIAKTHPDNEIIRNLCQQYKPATHFSLSRN